MKNIDLNDIDKDQVKGHWKVYNRTLNRVNHDYFTDINTLDLQKNLYRTVNGKVVEGEWEVIREKEIIFNPQIKFYYKKAEVGNAIITRLIEQEEQNGQKTHKLTLYFTTGLELILQKDNI